MQRPRRRATTSREGIAYLGRAAGQSSNISLLLLDGGAAAQAWRAEADGPNLDFAFDEATAALADLGRGLAAEVRPFSHGKLAGLGLNLGVGHGTLQVFRVDHRLVITECFIDDVGHTDFLAYVGAPTGANAASERLDAESGFVALLVAGGSYDDLPAKLAELGEPTPRSSRAKIGTECPGLVIAMGATRFRVSIEPMTTGPFGDAARAILDPIE
ncbi:MAG TPA: hypothetical protein VIU61_23880 [Kofleriaceae bacterium]